MEGNAVSMMIFCEMGGCLVQGIDACPARKGWSSSPDLMLQGLGSGASARGGGRVEQGYGEMRALDCRGIRDETEQQNHSQWFSPT